MYSAFASVLPGCLPMLEAVQDNFKMWMDEAADKEKAAATEN